MLFYVYLLRSETTGISYVGHTANLEARLQQHNENHRRYTSGKGPWKIVYTETFSTRAEAMKREKFFKTGAGRDFLKTVG